MALIAATCIGWLGGPGVNLVEDDNGPRRGTWEPVKPRSKTDRNGPCPCGSGKKFKRCCMGKGA